MPRPSLRRMLILSCSLVDCYSRAVVGCHAATVKDTAMVMAALKVALWRARPCSALVGAGLLQHSIIGLRSHLDFLRRSLVLAGIAASIGTVGDPYHNALAETTIGLFKTEAVLPDTRKGPEPSSSRTLSGRRLGREESVCRSRSPSALAGKPM